MMDQPNANPFSPLPLKLNTSLAVTRVQEIIDRLNFKNDRYPLKLEIVSGPDDLALDEPRYVEVTCSSVGKIKHFLDEFDALCAHIESGEGDRQRNMLNALLQSASAPERTLEPRAQIQAVQPMPEPQPAPAPAPAKRLEAFTPRTVPTGMGLDFGE